MRGGISILSAVAMLALGSCTTTHAPPAATSAPANTFDQDRTAILAMTGDFDVTFSFRETVSLTEGYALKPEKKTGGHEVVRVIKDDGHVISLQHILVAEAGGQKMAIKHWRQDWIYEPAEIFVFTGHNSFERHAVAPEEAKGAWAQLVYQVDDSPRYAGVAHWVHEDGVSSWTSPETWRPLPRREATTRNDYDVLLGVNRHVITPTGWAHEQDNSKLVIGEHPHILAREIAVNTYTRANDFDVSVATNYWTRTKAFWSKVSDEWLQLEHDHERFSITLEGETEKLYTPLLELADKVGDGKMSTDDAAAEAHKVIMQYVKF